MRPALRRDAAPLGLVFGGLLCGAAFAVWLLGLDHLPITVCLFKALTGLPCPTCGCTRMLAHLATGDLAGALLLNPLAAVGSALLLAWAACDAVLLPTGRSLVIRVPPANVAMLRWVAVGALVVNWAWLIASGV